MKQLTKKYNVTDSIRDTKLLEVLNQLSVYELNRLRKFVESPYFNRNEALVSLFEILAQGIRNQTVESLSKSSIWEAVFSELSYDDVKFRKLCSDLLKLTERFLIQEVFENNALQMADSLLTAVYNRKLEPLYSSSLRSARRMSEQYYFRPSTYHYYTYSLARGFFNLSGLELARTKQVNVEEMAGNLDKFYVAEKLRTYIMMSDSLRMATHDYELPFIEEIIDFVEAGNLRNVVPINLYYQIYLTRTDSDNLEHFEVLKSLIVQHLGLLPQLEAFEVLDSALNYCISRINIGDKHYLREYMEISLMGIENELLLVNGVLSPWTFRNIVVAGLRLGDFTWVRDFIDTYKHQIDSQYRENAVSFNLANLYFYQKKYDELLKLLRTVEYEDPSYNLNSKIMLLFTFYELKEFDSLSSILSSFELYLRRKKEIPASRKQHYMNLIKFVRALIRIPPGDDAALQKLRIKVEQTGGVVNKELLLEKIDELLD